MRGSTRIEGRARRGLLGQVGREALVEEQDGHVDRRAQEIREALRRACLLAALAAERQRQADDHLLRLLLADDPRELLEPRLGRGALDDAERPRDDPRRIGDRDAGARRAEVEGQHLHPSAAATACLPASSASRAPCGFLPPASASVGLPPPPPPMCLPSSRTSCTASSPCDTSVSSKLITRNARPSSLDA